MIRLKSIIVLFSTIVMAVIFANLNADSQSVATTDDYRAAEINPAALAYGNAAGLAFESVYEDDYRDEDYRLFFNSESFAFVYGKIDSFNHYRIASSHRLSRNIYLGGDMTWINSKYKKADYALSALVRPSNRLSLGANIKEINHSNPSYHLGVGIKPFWGMGSFGNTFEISADTKYDEVFRNGKSVEDWTKPTIGVNVEPMSGLRITGNYSLETESMSLGLALSLRRMRTGVSHYYDKDSKLMYGNYHLFLAKRELRSLPFPAAPQVYEFKVKREIVDEKQQSKFGPFVMIRKQDTLEDVVDQIRTLREDKYTQAIVFRNPDLKTNYANLLTLKQELLDFKETGKKIIVYSDNYGNLNYAFWAAVADYLYLNPNGSVNLIGIAIQVPYLSEMLEKLGIDVIDLKSHDYKTGLNIFTEKEMSSQEEESYRELIEQYYAKMVEMIEMGRGERIRQDIDTIINGGPYFDANEVLQLGLVDKLIFEDQLKSELKNVIAKAQITKTFPKEKLLVEWSEPRKEKVALIYLTGSIVMGEGMPGSRIGARTAAKQIRAAREDKTVKGIILRVNSGGGSAYASDVIAREVKLCREAGKPVIVSMGGAAASGGYYIAAYADRIIAEETTITGSIGVTGMIPNFTRLYDKIAIRWGTVKIGENADLFALHRPVEEREIELLRNYIDSSYRQFVNFVAEGRNMNYDEVHRIAQGRIWTGLKAKEIGLVDKIGGMREAEIAMSRMLGDKELAIADYSFSYDRFPITIGNDGLLSLKIRPELPEQLELLYKQWENYKLWENEKVLMKSPDLIITDQ